MQRSVTYAVGDVHGRADLLEAAVAHARDDAAGDGRLILIHERNPERNPAGETLFGTPYPAANLT